MSAWPSLDAADGPVTWVAGLRRHAQDPFAVKEKAFLYAAIALACLGLGAGRVALDPFRERRRRGGG